MESWVPPDSVRVEDISEFIDDKISAFSTFFSMNFSVLEMTCLFSEIYTVNPGHFLFSRVLLCHAWCLERGVLYTAKG